MAEAKKTSETSYRYIGLHPQDVQVGDRVVFLGTGDFVGLSDDDLKVDFVKELKSDGLLIKAEEGGSK